MNEHLFIVLWRYKDQPWKAESKGVFGQRRMAENFIENAKAAGDTYNFAIVEGSILTAETEEEAAIRLGTF